VSCWLVNSEDHCGSGFPTVYKTRKILTRVVNMKQMLLLSNHISWILWISKQQTLVTNIITVVFTKIATNYSNNRLIDFCPLDRIILSARLIETSCCLTGFLYSIISTCEAAAPHGRINTWMNTASCRCQSVITDPAWHCCIQRSVFSCIAGDTRKLKFLLFV
jgi:hypothetical protein